MSYLNQSDYVSYLCNCGSLKPISKIYFCRHCLKIRCGYCVCQEVDSHYCPSCMESLPSLEVRLKRNKCLNCFDCPCCFQTLCTRAGHQPVRVAPTDGEGAKATPKKVYYLVCSLCRWSSRDAGIPDQSVATGGWPEQENPHSRRINALIDYHKVMALIEKQQYEKKKFETKRPYHETALFSLKSAMIRKRFIRCIKPPPQPQSTVQPSPSIASEDVEELPPEIFTEPLEITKTTTLKQRLRHPEVQAEKVNELRPQHRQLLVKRSQRCRVCEHNVTKPDLCPQSPKFKIQLAAFYHVPEVRIVTCEPLRRGKSSELLLKFCNPTQHQTQITLFSLDTQMTPTTTNIVTKRRSKQENDKGEEENVQEGSESPNLLPALVRQVPIIEKQKPIQISVNADFNLPHSSLILPPRDDAAEYDDTGDNHNFQDDPKLVVWRKGNKAVIRLHVVPHEDIKESKGESVVMGFIMKYGYVNTIAALDNKTPQKLDLNVKLYLTIGNLVGDA